MPPARTPAPAAQPVWPAFPPQGPPHHPVSYSLSLRRGTAASPSKEKACN